MYGFMVKKIADNRQDNTLNKHLFTAYKIILGPLLIDVNSRSINAVRAR